MNLLIQKGNVTRDLELRYTAKGTAVLDIGVAVNRVWYTEAHEKKEEVTFTDWRAWGKQAETIAKFFHKGAPILLSGRLAQEEWEDKQTGQKRRKTLGIIDTFEFCGGQQRGAAEAPGGHPATRTRPAAAPTERGQAQSQEGLDGHTGDDDDIPF
jgi:single-strand DNA-binding protein